ncbi:unnamed protein product [Eruca vesicaria subsp. sativa]|uniref:mitogen-activated protein kinase kinase kinase n=1 Tax=Eruca vesicaria subsp. sativa TaxID=29727 RepID=A0ABC8LI49_ERUVS|nr:unnamed protein product [Eruca vesicaria subsp. sativa]
MGSSYHLPRHGCLSGFVGKITSSIRSSRMGLFNKTTPPGLPVPKKEEGPSAIRWRKGELIGCGAFGRVYMGMNLDSGELLAIKQFDLKIISFNCSKQWKGEDSGHIREIEEEVRLLKNLSHPNIVRYLGTVRESDSLNIFMEFVSGGSISSLLEKFGSFPEPITNVMVFWKWVLIYFPLCVSNYSSNLLISEALLIYGVLSWVHCDRDGYRKTSLDLPLSFILAEAHPPVPEDLSPEAKDFLLKCLHKFSAKEAIVAILEKYLLEEEEEAG